MSDSKVPPSTPVVEPAGAADSAATRPGILPISRGAIAATFITGFIFSVIGFWIGLSTGPNVALLFLALGATAGLVRWVLQQWKDLDVTSAKVANFVGLAGVVAALFAAWSTFGAVFHVTGV